MFGWLDRLTSSKQAQAEMPAPAAASEDFLKDALVDPLAAPSGRWVRRGDQGGQVEQIQDGLVSAGYLTAAQKAGGPGVFGPRTEAALQAFQADHGLPVTGEFDPGTSDAMSRMPGAVVCIQPTYVGGTSAPVAASEQDGAATEAPAVEGDVEPATAVEQAIAAAALGQSNGASSGQSDSSGSWWTDLEGDQEAYYSAIRAWHEAAQTGVTDAAQAEIAKTFEAESSYDATRAASIVERIAAVYSGSLPSLTEDGVLAFLGIRRQCVEFVNQIAAGAGGSYASQRQGKSVAWEDARPGMGWSTPDLGHYAAIVGVNKSEDGAVTSLVIKEANWGTGWANPGGQVPWERTVGQRTVSNGLIRSHG